MACIYHTHTFFYLLVQTTLVLHTEEAAVVGYIFQRPFIAVCCIFFTKVSQAYLLNDKVEQLINCSDVESDLILMTMH